MLLQTEGVMQLVLGRVSNGNLSSRLKRRCILSNSVEAVTATTIMSNVVKTNVRCLMFCVRRESESGSKDVMKGKKGKEGFPDTNMLFFFVCLNSGITFHPSPKRN